MQNQYLQENTLLHIARFYYHVGCLSFRQTFMSFSLMELREECEKYGGKIKNELGEVVYDSGIPTPDCIPLD